MIGSDPRKLVNGATLRSSSGAQVAIFVNIENAERFARTITGKTTDDIEVRLELDDPLNVDLKGWIQAIGVAKSPNTIQTKEIILFPEEDGQQPFDKKAANDVITFYTNCSDLMEFN